jgi:zinc protease
MVGDADPKLMEELIAARFGGWKGYWRCSAGAGLRLDQAPQRAGGDAFLPRRALFASIQWLRPYERLPNTKARERIDLARSLAARILNRRLEARARSDAPYVSAGIGEDRSANVADITSLSITAREGKWQEALAESFSIIADGLRSAPSEAEISRELQNLRTPRSRPSRGNPPSGLPQRAQQLSARSTTTRSSQALPPRWR